MRQSIHRSSPETVQSSTASPTNQETPNLGSQVVFASASRQDDPEDQQGSEYGKWQYRFYW